MTRLSPAAAVWAAAMRHDQHDDEGMDLFEALAAAPAPPPAPRPVGTWMRVIVVDPRTGRLLGVESETEAHGHDMPPDRVADIAEAFERETLASGWSETVMVEIRARHTGTVERCTPAAFRARLGRAA